MSARIGKPEEIAIIERARQGDRAAFGQVVSVYETPLRGFISARIWASWDDVEDIVQQTWLETFQKIEKTPDEGGYDPARASFYHWVKTCIAEYQIRRWVGERTRRELPSAGGVCSGERDTPMEAPDPQAVTPDVLAERIERHLLLLRLVFMCGGYPHQQLAFVLSQYIYGTSRKGRVRGDPSTVDQKHGSEPLERLVETFRSACQAESRIGDEELMGRLTDCLTAVRERLELEVGRLFQQDRHSLDACRPLLKKPVRETSLRDYYAGHAAGFTDAIPDWCHKVRTRLKQVLAAGPDACPRCKLRHIPPCDEPTARTPPQEGTVASKPDVP